MEDCLHTSSENLSKLVSWAHSHGTICSLIPNLKHLLTEGAHGNLTAMWGCSAGHAYHWPLTATCKTGPKDRVCYQDSRSLGSDSLSLQAPGIPGDRFLARASKGKGPDCGQTRDSCDFSNCSEPSEVDDNTEDYNSNLFDIVCESSATDEDGDYELQNTPRTAPRKRGVPGAAQGDQWRQRMDETPGDPAVKKIKQEIPEDYYTVANAQLSGGMDHGPMSPSPKQATHRLPPLQTALVNKASPVEGADLPAPSPSPSGKSTPSMVKPHRAPPPVAQGGPQVTILPKSDYFYGPAGPQPYRPDQSLNIPLLPPQLPGPSELADPMCGDSLGKPGGAPLPLRDTDDSPAGVSSDLEVVPAQTLGSDPKAEGSVCVTQKKPCRLPWNYKLHPRFDGSITLMQVQREATAMPPKTDAERSRTKREKIKNDSEKYEAAKKKDRERKKQARALQRASMTASAKKEKRRKEREAKRRQRQKKKEARAQQTTPKDEKLDVFL